MRNLFTYVGVAAVLYFGIRYATMLKDLLQGVANAFTF